MDIKHFALQEWCERDLITLHKIHTTHNWADALTKPQGKTLFYRHMNHIMGRIKPQYVNSRFDTSIKLLCQSRQFHSMPGQHYEIGGGCDKVQYMSQPDIQEWRGKPVE